MRVTPSEVTAFVGSLAFVGAMIGVRYRWLADQRDAWWKRAQWAIDKSCAEDPEQRRIGAEAMNVLADDKHASTADLEVLDAALVRAIDNSDYGGDDQV